MKITILQCTKSLSLAPRRFILKGLLLPLALPLVLTPAACAQTNPATPVSSTSPTYIAAETSVRNLIFAMNKRDAKAIRASFAPNAKQRYGMGAFKEGAAFFRWLESDIIQREGHVDNAQFSAGASENEVMVTGQYSSKGYSNKANFLFSIEGDKIASWSMRY